MQLWVARCWWDNQHRLQRVENYNLSAISFLNLDRLSAGEALVVPEKALVYLVKKSFILFLHKRQHWQEVAEAEGAQIMFSYLSLVRLIRSRVFPKLAGGKREGKTTWQQKFLRFCQLDNTPCAANHHNGWETEQNGQLTENDGVNKCNDGKKSGPAKAARTQSKVGGLFSTIGIARCFKKGRKSPLSRKPLGPLGCPIQQEKRDHQPQGKLL